MSNLHGFLNATPEKPHYEDVAEAEYKALRKDAERYRWLKTQPTWLGWDADFQPDEIEREVDAAMASKPAVGAA